MPGVQARSSGTGKGEKRRYPVHGQAFKQEALAQEKVRKEDILYMARRSSKKPWHRKR